MTSIHIATIKTWKYSYPYIDLSEKRIITYRRIVLTIDCNSNPLDVFWERTLAIFVVVLSRLVRILPLRPCRTS